MTIKCVSCGNEFSEEDIRSTFKMDEDDNLADHIDVNEYMCEHCYEQYYEGAEDEESRVSKYRE